MSKGTIGIMQGRLSPPRDGAIQSFPKSTWRDEFYKAEQIGFANIEWIFEQDQYTENPLADEDGIKEINDIVRETGVTVESVCADYFMDIPYLKATYQNKKELKEKFEWLVVQARKIGADYVDLPFVDGSKITASSQFSQIKDFLLAAARTAEELDITIALETSLNPTDFQKLLLFLNYPSVMANYDTGNSASLGYNFQEESSTYGKWITTVHIKDRLLKGGTVPLGSGDTDFDIFFRELENLKYAGPIILQAAREGNEVGTAISNKKFVQNYLARDKR